MLNSSFKQMDDLIYTVLTETYCPGLILARGCLKHSIVFVFREPPVTFHSSGIYLGSVRKKIYLGHQL
jgi:hypothetical protein